MADSEPASTPPAPPPQTLGEMLRNARLVQDLTLEQLSTELRIEARQLAALEDERFEQIGVPVFIKGYLKQYGTRLGLNVADLLALYYKQTTLADVQVQPSKTIKLHDERQITSWVIAGIVLLAVVAGLAWWWNDGNLGALPLTRSTPEPATTSTPEAAEPAARPQALQAEPLPAGEPSQPDTAASVGSNDSAANVVPVAAPAAAAPEAVVEAVENVPPRDAVPLEFSFEQESWAEVTDARGERLLYGLNAAGRTVSVRGEPPFAVVLGNANAVRLTVDGEPYELPQTGRQGDLARFSVNVAGD